ncbi:hypothetical protein [Jannaschia sp. W003]|uniref:hypothetical protein n=1 Tax=Jannaschia sp. W003 TaxID=2867012 RepID=UPI0021A2A1C9|nr:hypothetical protein [Jannaschia sp. W003]UWQ20125.1 hypothetical protein K3554_08895 [Jannaschia sp. W003]
MTEPRTFTVATDAEVVALIEAARRRLVVVAPALSLEVAEALLQRFGDLGQLDIRVIVDADPEVYRLGFGETKALKVIRRAASENLLDLREQPGVRIGVVVSDEDTMIFAPVSKNIEAGSETEEKPNAIILRGNAANALACAAGADLTSGAPQGEIGNTALDPCKVVAMEADLGRNPPAKFDIARRMQVFSSRVVYVEFEIRNFTLGRKQVPLPPEFQIVGNTALRNQITSRLRAPIEQLGAVEVTIGSGEDARQELIDDAWLRARRKKIEDRYTFQIDNFGRVILREDRDEFEAAVEDFSNIVASYHKAVRKALKRYRDDFCESFVAEFLPRWEASPPDYIDRWRRASVDIDLPEELVRRANEVFEEMVSFAPPAVRLIEKNVSPKNVEDRRFLEPLRQIMEKRRVSREIIETLFASGSAAPEQPDLLKGT